MKPFRERNPITIGIVGLVVTVLAALAAFNADSLPIVGGGTTYTANVREAAGLKSKDSVRIAGVKVGTVSDVEVENDHVKVSFTVSDAFVGDQSEAAVKLQTLLGQKYLSVESRGGKALDPSTPLPEDTAESIYFDVQDAFSGLTDTVQKVDTSQLARSFGVLSDTFQNTPGNVRGALDGLAALSRTISSRDSQLGRLLANTKRISRTLADRDREIQRLFADGNLLLGEVARRKAAISALLTGTQALSAELSGLVDDNNAQLRPVLDSLEELTSMLRRNQDSLGAGLERLAPFVRLLNNTVGNGRWFDIYICGLLPPSISVLNSQGCLPPYGESGGN